jgi:phage terminase Nu1 subunit (DNA packaging protein)
LEISVRRVSQLKNSGMPCDSIAGATAWRSKHAGDDSVAELRRKRIKLIEEQTRREELENRRRRGEMMPISEHHEISLRCATAARMAFWALLDSLPPMLSGLTETPIAIILEREFRDCLDRLSGGDPELWESAQGRRIIELIEQEFPSPTKP